MRVVAGRILLVLLTVGLVMLVGACAGAEPTATPTPTTRAVVGTPTPTTRILATPTPTTTPTPVATAKYGGVLTVGIHTPPAGVFDNLHTSTVGTAGFVSQLYVSLTGYGWENRFGPYRGEMAKSWDVSADGTVYTFRLAENAKFHDGSLVTADDVKASIQAWVANPSPFQPYYKTIIKTVEAPNNTTVVVTLNYASAGFLNYVSEARNAIYPRKVLDGLMGGGGKNKITLPDKDNMVGSGPFKFVSYDQDAGMTLAKYEEYFERDSGGGKLPYLDGVKVIGPRDEATRCAAFRAGRIDLLVSIAMSPQCAEILIKEKFPGTVYQQNGSNYWPVLWPLDRGGPLADRRVRYAMHLVWDRAAGGKVVDPTGYALWSWIPEFMGGRSEAEVAKLPGWRYPKDQDIAEAKRLMEEAGYAAGFEAKAFHQPDPQYQAAALVYCQQLKVININCTLDSPRDTAEYADRKLISKRAFMMSLGDRQVTQPPEPDEMLMKYFLPGAIYNFAGISDPELIDLVNKQSRIMDPGERAKVLRQIEDILIYQQYLPMFHWSGYWTGWQPYVKGYVKPHGINDYHRQTRTWLDK